MQFGGWLKSFVVQAHGLVRWIGRMDKVCDVGRIFSEYSRISGF